VPDRAYAYVEHEGRVAVFVHAGTPDAGCQVPGGGVEAGESSEAAVLRETLEESGLECEIVEYLGLARRAHWDPTTQSTAETSRHFFHLRPLSSPPEFWSWHERHASDGSGPNQFDFCWLSIPDAGQRIDFGFDALLSKLDPSLALAVAADRRASALVAESYDMLADRYVAWSTASDAVNLRHRYIDRVVALGANGRCLDLGCGTGDLATAHLVAGGFEVIGLDSSKGSIERAASCHPRARFAHGDMTAFSFPIGFFDFVVAFNSVIHVPRPLHAGLFRDVRRWLRPGGWFVLNVEQDGDSGAGLTEPWIDGTSMYWSAWPSDVTVQLLTEAGLEVLTADIENQEGFLWLICRRPRTDT
jgi:SAM-dependent methyltransferase/8-oxo-dGTP pyrophosphatase MutT (NUDIX family)